MASQVNSLFFFRWLQERKTKSELNSKMNAMREEFAKFLSLEDQKTDKPLAVRAKMKALSER